MKKVLLAVIDGLCSRVVHPAMEQGRLPTLQRLAEAGAVDWKSTSSFPSITPAATSSICTGAYPAEHGIAGAHFLDREEDEVHYYGSDFWVVIDRGAPTFVNDMLMNLNHQRLNSQTLFELIETAGLEAASLNYLIFRGLQEHQGRVPWILRMWPGVRWQADLRGPGLLCLGDFVGERLVDGEPEHLEASGGPTNRFGFCDQSTGELLLQLPEQGLPDFTLAYFPDNDFDSHQRGPQAALDKVEQVDEILSEFLEELGGIDAALEELAIIVTGDHGHDDIDEESDVAAVDLSKALTDFSLANLGTAWKDEDDLMVCPNLRAAQVYVRPKAKRRWDEIVEASLACDGVDLVLWQMPACDDRESGFKVATRDRGNLEFISQSKASGEMQHDWAHGRDDYGRSWCFRGELKAVDAHLEGDDIAYGEYPNALERIAMAFEPRVTGDLWLSAKPGKEFYCPGNVVHAGGGSHGSLHECDSLSPLIAAGLPSAVALPEHPRLIDVVPLVLRILEVDAATPASSATLANAAGPNPNC